MMIRRKPSLAELSKCFMPSSTSKHHIEYNKKEIKELFANPAPQLFDLTPLINCIHVQSNRQFAELLQTLIKYNSQVESIIQNEHLSYVVANDSLFADKKKMACLKFVYLQMIKMVKMNQTQIKQTKIAKKLQDWYFSVFQKHLSIFNRHYFKTKHLNAGIQEQRIRQSFQTNPAKQLYDYHRKKLFPSEIFQKKISLSSDLPPSSEEFPKHLYSKLYWREEEILREIREERGEKSKIKQIKMAREKRRNAALKKVLTCCRQGDHTDPKNQNSFYITEQTDGKPIKQKIKKTNFSSHSSMAMTLCTFQHDQIQHIPYPKLPSVSLASQGRDRAQSTIKLLRI